MLISGPKLLDNINPTIMTTSIIATYMYLDIIIAHSLSCSLIQRFWPVCRAKTGTATNIRYVACFNENSTAFPFLSLFIIKFIFLNYQLFRKMLLAAMLIFFVNRVLNAHFHDDICRLTYCANSYHTNFDGEILLS